MSLSSSPHFAIFKNVVHSLEPGETPISQNTLKRCVAVAVRVFFLNLLKSQPCSYERRSCVKQSEFSLDDL